eukprot:CAMPEP_0174246712 /NCGR_PEP_ID=MMETSP0417-20130205/42209_1 /TAXON_ID=242541 /ORGANISM="Mayorella sp, Strain BSH-02190019" /LENGTH=657 /DNA_ID=CAMNT_0015326565 /DNA_START=36 /DNA_END=2009 /DNA_ORIENTATION=+
MALNADVYTWHRNPSSENAIARFRTCMQRQIERWRAASAAVEKLSDADELDEADEKQNHREGVDALDQKARLRRGQKKVASNLRLVELYERRRALSTQVVREQGALLEEILVLLDRELESPLQHYQRDRVLFASSRYLQLMRNMIQRRITQSTVARQLTSIQSKLCSAQHGIVLIEERLRLQVTETDEKDDEKDDRMEQVGDHKNHDGNVRAKEDETDEATKADDAEDETDEADTANRADQADVADEASAAGEADEEAASAAEKKQEDLGNNDRESSTPPRRCSLGPEHTAEGDPSDRKQATAPAAAAAATESQRQPAVAAGVAAAGDEGAGDADAAAEAAAKAEREQRRKTRVSVRQHRKLQKLLEQRKTGIVRLEEMVVDLQRRVAELPAQESLRRLDAVYAQEPLCELLRTQEAIRAELVHQGRLDVRAGASFEQYTIDHRDAWLPPLLDELRAEWLAQGRMSAAQADHYLHPSRIDIKQGLMFTVQRPSASSDKPDHSHTAEGDLFVYSKEDNQVLFYCEVKLHCGDIWKATYQMKRNHKELFGQVDSTTVLSRHISDCRQVRKPVFTQQDCAQLKDLGGRWFVITIPLTNDSLPVPSDIKTQVVESLYEAEQVSDVSLWMEILRLVGKLRYPPADRSFRVLLLDYHPRADLL